MEIQQSPLYADYIRSLGWVIENLEGNFIFIKPFPIIGGLAKIQRVKTLPNQKRLLLILKKYHIRTLAIEPDCTVRQSDFSRWCRRITPYVRVSHDSFIPTKTIRVNLTPPVDTIFHRMSEAKRRAVRRAEKNTITVSQTNDFNLFLRLKHKSAGFLGFITTAGVERLWQKLPIKNKSVLLAYTETHQKPVAGIFLIFWNRIAYYWIAGASREGKKLFAPTLLVWEALKVAKAHKCRALDFVGVWDERRPNQNHEWKGFTKFKEGFGGKSLYYPLP